MNAAGQVAAVISGGQTGVDRAALDFAIGAGIAHGGFCPKGRKAGDGTIPPGYRLVETSSARYAQRTEKNVAAADGTLVLCSGTPRGGTLLTVALCRKKRRPVCLVDPLAPSWGEVEKFRSWLVQNRIRVLNVAGPRDNPAHSIYRQALACLRTLFHGVPEHVPE